MRGVIRKSEHCSATVRNEAPARSTKCRKRTFLKKFRWALSSMGKTPAAAKFDRMCQPSKTKPFFWISTIPLPARHRTST